MKEVPMSQELSNPQTMRGATAAADGAAKR